jgi:vacuolar protein sorting-associated protein 13A/C
MQQLYKIVGSLDVIGNPVGLVNGLGSGVHDFFYQPVQGLVKSPKDFVGGVFQGTTSLFKSVVSGLCDSASRVTSSAARGAASATLDDEFIKKQQHKTPPRHVVEGLEKGATSLGTGLVSGLKGVIKDPIKGAKQKDPEPQFHNEKERRRKDREAGCGGFCKGLGTGLLGVISKPVAGAMDLASNTLQGIGNTPAYILDHDAAPGPVRPPRQFESNHLEVFDMEKAKQQEKNLQDKYKAESQPVRTKIREKKNFEKKKTPTKKN